jgi:hypothetical protein
MKTNAQLYHTPYSCKGTQIFNSFGVKIADCINAEIAKHICESVNVKSGK